MKYGINVMLSLGEFLAAASRYVCQASCRDMLSRRSESRERSTHKDRKSFTDPIRIVVTAKPENYVILKYYHRFAKLIVRI